MKLPLQIPETPQDSSLLVHPLDMFELLQRSSCGRGLLSTLLHLAEGSLQ